MRFDIIIPDSVMEMGIYTNLNFRPIEGQVFRGSIVTHKFAEAIAHVLSIRTFQIIGYIEVTLVDIDMDGDISPKGLTLSPNRISRKLPLQSSYTKLPVGSVSSANRQ